MLNIFLDYSIQKNRKAIHLCKRHYSSENSAVHIPYDAQDWFYFQQRMTMQRAVHLEPGSLRNHLGTL